MNYLPLMQTHAEPIPAGDLSKLEQLVGAPVPQSYADFLSQSNGGSFQADIVALPELGTETVLNYMFSTVDGSYDIVREYANLRSMDRIPVQTLPIADDPGGNLFLLSVEQDRNGAIFFWDHEREPPDGGSAIADFPNMTRVADDFATFIRALKEAEA
ncbi:SMI1/KNR4 family protein [Inquilinus sp. YAF38]|uniref:SMI1/KNR4 family protein n=1 Tax=Inquilinus sp. YAF38 TaxID=3233084 RepID=UPI003F91FC6E